MSLADHFRDIFGRARRGNTPVYPVGPLVEASPDPAAPPFTPPPGMHTVLGEVQRKCLRGYSQPLEFRRGEYRYENEDETAELSEHDPGDGVVLEGCGCNVAGPGAVGGRSWITGLPICKACDEKWKCTCGHKAAPYETVKEPTGERVCILCHEKAVRRERRAKLLRALMSPFIIQG